MGYIRNPNDNAKVCVSPSPPRFSELPLSCDQLLISGRLVFLEGAQAFQLGCTAFGTLTERCLTKSNNYFLVFFLVLISYRFYKLLLSPIFLSSVCPAFGGDNIKHNA